LIEWRMIVNKGSRESGNQGGRGKGRQEREPQKAHHSPDMINDVSTEDGGREKGRNIRLFQKDSNKAEEMMRLSRGGKKKKLQRET